MPRPKGSKNKPKPKRKKKVTEITVNEPKRTRRVIYKASMAPIIWEQFDLLCCPKCNKIMPTDGNFYKSKNPMFFKGFLPFCKTCVKDIYDYYHKMYVDEEQAFFNFCRRIDIPYISSVFRSVESVAGEKKRHIVPSYFIQLNSFGEVNSYGVCFDDSKEFIKLRSESTLEGVEDIDVKDTDYFKVTNGLADKWNIKNAADILFLEREYQDWCGRCKVETKPMEINVKNICFQQLAISKKQAIGSPVKEDLAALSKLMADSALTPNKEDKSQASDGGIGVWIQKIEEEEPIGEPLPEFRDPDNLLRYITVWFIGQMCKICGMENPYQDEYDDEMLKYEVLLETEKPSNDESEEEETEDGE